MNLQVLSRNDELVIDSRVIADELGIQHKNLLEAIRKYQSEIEEFGHLAFETETVTNSVGAVNSVIFTYLNEDQATYLLTLSKNSDKVRFCKRNLVRAFRVAKTELSKNTHAMPQTYKEALLALIAKEEEKERLEQEKALLQTENKLLEDENCQLSEQLDELFEYSSILRIAKFNHISELNFSWRKLKATSIQLGIPIKIAPDPRFGTKNLYSHDVWRIAYPKAKLPETTTLVISKPIHS